MYDEIEAIFLLFFFFRVSFFCSRVLSLFSPVTRREILDSREESLCRRDNERSTISFDTRGTILLVRNPTSIFLATLQCDEHQGRRLSIRKRFEEKKIKVFERFPSLFLSNNAILFVREQKKNKKVKEIKQIRKGFRLIIR